MNMLRTSAFIAVAGILASTGLAGAAIDLQITEIYAGIPGNQDGTPDWAEITNFGDTAADLINYKVNDNSGAFGTSVALPSFNLAPGASVILLLEGAPADITTFNNLWGPGISSIATGGSGLGLGEGGDGVYLYDAASQALVVKQDFTGGFTGVFQTIEYLPAGFSPALSTDGVHGAYTSGLFASQSNGQVALIGSPGTIPAPAASALLGLGGLVVARRRRA